MCKNCGLAFDYVSIFPSLTLSFAIRSSFLSLNKQTHDDFFQEDWEN